MNCMCVEHGRFTEHDADFKQQITAQSVWYSPNFVSLYIKRYLEVCYSKYAQQLPGGAEIWHGFCHILNIFLHS